jgi:Uma2 family endonuclease
MTTIALDLRPFVAMTDEQFHRLCREHPELRFERTAEGVLLVMTPVGGETGHLNSELTFQVQSWSRARPHLGLAFDSSTGFKLPNGADRSPDASWVQRERWQALDREVRRRFPPLCPDFVVELRSPSDSLPTLQQKMREYIENGAQLGWLIDPEVRRVEVYRPGTTVEVLESPTALPAEPVLPGFVLDCTALWAASEADGN